MSHRSNQTFRLLVKWRMYFYTQKLNKNYSSLNTCNIPKSFVCKYVHADKKHIRECDMVRWVRLNSKLLLWVDGSHGWVPSTVNQPATLCTIYIVYAATIIVILMHLHFCSIIKITSLKAGCLSAVGVDEKC